MVALASFRTSYMMGGLLVSPRNYSSLRMHGLTENFRLKILSLLGSGNLEQYQLVMKWEYKVNTKVKLAYVNGVITSNQIVAIASRLEDKFYPNNTYTSNSFLKYCF